jgi:glycosyltransferase involved in cell wall biosynthesis
MDVETMQTRMQDQCRPLVSIVLPTFNRAEHLSQALESCLSQTYDNLEIIVVDDGSTDHTSQVAGQVAGTDPRVRYVWQEHQRLPTALNTGHHAARGEYLTWTSDDNLYEADAIERMLSYLESHPETGLVYCDVQYIGPRGDNLGIREYAGPEMLKEWDCVGACFLYRRAVYETVGDYSPDLFLSEDYDYWLRVSFRFGIAHLAGVAPYRYRLHSASLSSQKKALVIVQAARTRCRHVVPPAQRVQVMARAYCYAFSVLCVKIVFSFVWRCVSLSLSVWPVRLANWKPSVLAALERLLASLGHRHSAHWLLPR